jgi:hypothetical protein
MNEFRTIVDVPKSSIKINHSNKILAIGSCFAQNIGKKLLDCGFQCSVNPMGILYNPLSILNSLKLASGKLSQFSDDFLEEGEQHYSYYFHSNFRAESQIALRDLLRNELQRLYDVLRDANVVIISLGTSLVYRLKKSGRVVSNCHKTPAAQFDLYKLTLEETCSCISEITETLNRDAIKKPLIIFTVSPIRHFKDGAVENQRSKSTLLLAMDYICKKFDNALYFPSYEIMMDDLRDYRFYAEDMIHPSTVAVDYIWKSFAECFFEGDTKILISKINDLNRASLHRPFNPNSHAYKSFILSQINEINKIKTSVPEINLECYLRVFEEKLKAINPD